MGNVELLFSGDFLEDHLRFFRGKIEDEVRKVSDGVFLSTSEEDIIKNIVAAFRVGSISIDEEKVKKTPTMIKTDVTGDHRFFSPFGERVIVDANRVDFDIPFSGDEWIFRCKPGSYSFSPPRAEILPSVLRISFVILDCDPDNSDMKYKEEMTQIREFVEKANYIIKEHNDSLPNLVAQEVAKHKSRLERNRSMSSMAGKN